MKTILITPPHFYFSNTLAIPRLVAYLKAQGHDVEQLDIDMEIYSQLLGKEELTRTFEKIVAVILPRFNRKGNSAHTSAAIKEKFVSLGGGWFDYKDFAELIADKNNVIERIHYSTSLLQSKFFTLGTDKFFEHFKCLSAGMHLVSLAHYPTQWSPVNGISMKYSPQVIDDILAGIEDEQQNFLIDYYRRYTIPQIRAKQPRVIGVSMNHFSQFIPGFTLIYEIKKCLPECYVTIGGESVTMISRFFSKENRLWHLINSLTVGIGEYSLEALLSALSEKRSRSKVPNLIFKEGSRIQRSDIDTVPNLDEFPIPEFTENRPRPIIPLAASTGCSWGRCAFCHYPYIHYGDMVQNAPPYLVRSLDNVIEDIAQLNEKYRPLYFHFADTNITPDRLEGIADGIISRSITTRFFSFMRAEEAFTSRSFCTKLAQAGYIGGYFGLESASEHTNKRMNKNIDLKNIPQILKNFDETGIIANLFCIVGFPEETEEEAWQTYHFLKKHLHRIKGEISISYFHLKYNTPIFRHPEAFGIKRIMQDDTEDFISRYNYEVTKGLPQNQAEELAERFNRELGLQYIGMRFIGEVLKKDYMQRERNK